jgi:hypothetical protein
VFFLAGSTGIELILFSVGLLSAVALLMGYRTRLAVFLSWIFLLGLQARNPLILQGDDVLRRVMLFWGMFLPLGARCSLDRKFEASDDFVPRSVTSMATVAFLFQTAMIYWVAGLSKLHPVWISEGSGIYYALSTDYLVTPFGRYMLQFPTLIRLLSLMVVPVEVGLPLLLFIPLFRSRMRIVAIGLAVVFHLSMASCLNLALFSPTCIAVWLAFLPGLFWDRLSRSQLVLLITGIAVPMEQFLTRLKKYRDKRLRQIAPGKTFIPGDVFTAGFTKPIERRKLVSNAIRRLIWRIATAVTEPAGDPSYAPRRKGGPGIKLNWRTQVFVGACLLCVFGWNVRTMRPAGRITRFISSIVDRPLVVLGLDQRWFMFSPYPFRNNGWQVVEGELQNSSKVDLLRDGQPIRWDKPDHFDGALLRYRQRQYMVVLSMSWNTPFRKDYGAYLCREWNTKHSGDQELKSLKMFYMVQETLPNYQVAPTWKLLLLEYSCQQPPRFLPVGADYLRTELQNNDTNPQDRQP